MAASRALRTALSARPAGAAAACLRSSAAASAAAPAASRRPTPSLPSIARRDAASSSRTIASSAPDSQAIPVDTPAPEVRAPRGTGQSSGRNLLGEVLASRPTHQTALRPIYLDSQSTTALDPRVLDVMLPLLTNRYGNPHSRTHAYGWEAEEAVETARQHVGALIGADAKEIIFTSGATESNNLALKGAAHFYGAKKNHIITVQTEHKCVLDSCRTLQEEGYEVTYLPVQHNGLIRLEDLEAALRPTTAIVSIMSVNNEIGVIQPLKEIGHLLKTKGAALAKEAGLSGKPLFHTDGAQAVGKIPFDVNEIGADIVSMSSHKIYGPKGIGAIYIRRRPRVRLTPIISGGGQERGLRSGTLAPAQVAGMGEAARLAKAEREYDYAHVTALSKRLRERIESKVTHVLFNGDEGGYPGCVNLTFQYVEGESLLMALKRVCLSSGSACTSASLEPSYVLRALGLNDENAHSSLRFGMGRFTTTEEVDFVADQIITVVEKLRDMSPLWEMVQEGIDLDSIQWSE